MTYLCYVEKKFSAESSELLRQSNIIIDEYAKQGLKMTLRQLFYQMVTKNVFANDDRNYKKLGDVISDGRLAGLISWDAIEDRTRFVRGRYYFNGPKQCVLQARNSYMIDRWAGQPFRPIVGIEKDALIGVIEEICHELCVDYTSFRGYSSQSELWRLGQRFANDYRRGQQPIVFHLGDHDPSGLDMTRDLAERLSLFAGTQVQVVRLALNKAQVEQYSPPPNPAKLSDVRAAAYVAEHGYSSWELDALKPNVLANLIRSNILKLRDEKLWEERLAEEANDKHSIDIAIHDAFPWEEET